jgi:hypothetical protein
MNPGAADLIQARWCYRSASCQVQGDRAGMKGRMNDVLAAAKV